MLGCASLFRESVANCYGIERLLTTCFAFATHADFCVSESSRTRSGDSSTESDDNENGTVEAMPACQLFKVVFLRGTLDFGFHDIVDLHSNLN
jgi:hypothetical protein